MKKLWYDEIFDLINKVLLVKLPFEFIHFPDTGVHSAIGMYAGLGNLDPEFPVKCFYIDLRTAQFTDERKHNRAEFNRTLRTFIEIYASEKLEDDSELNMFRLLENLFLKYLQQNKKVLIAFDNSAQIKLDKVPEFRDLLVFLDQMRFSHKGNVNYFISTSVPIFSEKNPPPCPIITQYFNYYRPGWLFRSINEEVLVGPFKKHSSEETLKLIEVTGGLVSLAKNLMRDFIILGKKIGDLETLIVDDNFFDVFINCKMRLDRMRLQISNECREALHSIVINGNAIGVNREALNFLSQTGIIDENNKVRGLLIPQYIKKYYQNDDCADISNNITIPSEVTAVVVETPSRATEEVKHPESDIVQEAEGSDLISINSSIQINTKSGSILRHKLPQAEYFTENELKVFLLLNNNLNAPVAREAIAKVLWSDTGGNDYSDWAIDKMISRIREKLHDNKPYRLIKTIRGIGFELIN